MTCIFSTNFEFEIANSDFEFDSELNSEFGEFRILRIQYLFLLLFFPLFKKSGIHGHDRAGDFRTKFWSMLSGPYCRPKHWKRNTAIPMAGVFLLCIPIAMISVQLEVASFTFLPLPPFISPLPQNARFSVLLV